MMKIYVVLTICCMALLSASNIATAQTKEKKAVYSWSKDLKHIALLRNDTVLWQLNIDPSEDKPYFHPLRTPAGYELTLKRPADHPWHRGLWFSWKDINGVNYWEEDRKKGISAGRSLIKKVSSKLHRDFSACITIEMAYEDKNGITMLENRILHISSPVKQSGYKIIWEHFFTMQKDVRLYLEKPGKHGGVPWGGYTGLSFRGTLLLKDPVFTASDGWRSTKDTTGYGSGANWMDLTGSVGENNHDFAGITIFDHPGNVRHPTPWYIWHVTGKNLYFNASLLFDGPLQISKAGKLTLKYETYIHDGQFPVTELEKMFTAFVKQYK